MTIIPQNLTALNLEIDWLSKVIEQAIATYLLQEGNEKNWQDIPLPSLNENTTYGQFVIQHQLDVYSRLALALAIAPHLRPQALDIFFSKNAMYDRGFTEFGGLTAKNHSGFLPTAQTLSFLITVSNPLLFEKVMELLSVEHVLQQNEVLTFGETASDLPKLSAALSISQQWFQHWVTGEQVEETSDNQFGRIITTPLNWEDLVLDPQVAAQLQEITTWCEHENKLMQDWGLNQKLEPGYRTLFYGAPGTGKTLTAALIGKNLAKTVYLIDLSMVVSKYIGETEKNLAQVFKTATQKNWVLFFDEADALFGKRTAIADANDRYANVEVAYLLQRIAEFPGLVILSASLKENLDVSFLQTFQTVIYFPHPGPEQRLQLWRNAFSGRPSLDPSIDLPAIATKYELTGGAILNVLRYCAITVVKRNEEVVTEKDLMNGIERELGENGM